jgi:hypothetical protein
MKKHSLVRFFMAACLAGFMGQLAAFGQTTNSVWNVNAVSALSAGKIKDTQSNSATAVFLSNGSCSFSIGSREIDGTYTNTTKSLAITLSTNGVAALESNAYDFVTSLVPSGVTISIKSSKFPTKIALKDGIPVKAEDKISGKGSEVVKGKTKSKSFTVTDLLIDWSLSSGTNTFLAQ